MPAGDPTVLIDTSILVKGQQDPAWFASIVAGRDDLATCDVVVGEFEIGLYAPREKKTREQVREFVDASIMPLMKLPHVPEDFHEASRLIGEAIHASKAKPSFPDGLIAAVSRRANLVIWTTDETDFKAMGCQTSNPWASKQPAGQGPA